MIPKSRRRRPMLVFWLTGLIVVTATALTLYAVALTILTEQRRADAAEPAAAASHHGEPRSPQWPKVRAAYLAKHPVCEACGSKGTAEHPLQCHHIRPFHWGEVNEEGEPLELDPKNLITLCVDGVGHTNCHLMIGHGGNFQCANLDARRDAARFREMLADRVCEKPANTPARSQPPPRKSERSRELAP
jgi:5-methylcytosine-specific restriction protein A